MKILFSPIGNTDPYRNLRDGAMLHIVRNYQPDKVILFFTKSIYEGNKKNTLNKNIIPHKDYEWELLIKSVSKNIILDEQDIHIEDINKENDFDIYKDYFHNIIQEIHVKYPDAEVLLNVTSGTPQMEATLCLEYITYPKNKKCIQVSTPIKSSNANVVYDDMEISPLEMIELVNEEEKDYESRCKEINILSFRESMIKNQLKALIQSYNYYGAKVLIENEGQINWNPQLTLKLDNIIKSINNNKIFTAIDKKTEYNENFKKALFSVLLIDLRLKQNNYSDALIRIKNVAEFLAVLLIQKNNKEIIKKNKEGKRESWIISEKFYDEFKKKYYINNARFEKKSELNLLYYISIANFLNDEKLENQLEEIKSINELRNSIAHSLDELNITMNSSKINEAYNILIEMLKSINRKIEIKMLNYFDNFNNELEGLL